MKGWGGNNERRNSLSEAGISSASGTFSLLSSNGT